MKIADFASPYSPLLSSLGFLLLLKLLSFPGFNSVVCCPALENKLEKEALMMKFRGEIYDQRLASKMALLLRDELL